MKIEIDKPVVPVWFDEWYRTFKEDKSEILYVLLRTGWSYGLTNGYGDVVEDWVSKMEDVHDDFHSAKEYLSKAILLGYEVEEPLYYVKNKLTGQYLKDTSEIFWGSKPSWVNSKNNIDVVKMTKKDFKHIFKLDETNADFEEVE